MRGLKYLLGIHRVDVVKEIMDVMVEQADDGDPSCEKGRGVIAQGNSCKQETLLSQT